MTKLQDSVHVKWYEASWSRGKQHHSIFKPLVWSLEILTSYSFKTNQKCVNYIFCMTNTNHMNSRHIEQKVGCRKNVAINLCPLTWWIRRLHALRRLCITPSFSLNSFSFGTSEINLCHTIMRRFMQLSLIQLRSTVSGLSNELQKTDICIFFCRDKHRINTHEQCKHKMDVSSRAVNIPMVFRPHYLKIGSQVKLSKLL